LRVLAWDSLVEFRISCLSALISLSLIYRLLTIILISETDPSRRINSDPVVPSQGEIDLISDDDLAILVIVLSEIGQLALDDPVLVNDVLVAVLEVDEAAEDLPLLVAHLSHLHLQSLLLRLQGSQLAVHLLMLVPLHRHDVLDLQTQLVQVELDVLVCLVVRVSTIMLITICTWIIDPYRGLI